METKNLQTLKPKLFHKDFTLVLIGQIISLFGNGILRFAMPLHLLKTTGSSTIFGLVTAISFVPMIILTPIGGIIADRVNKRNVMVILDFFTALLMGIFLISIGKIDLVTLIIITMIILYGVQGAYQPTVQASIPLLSVPENLLTANALINQVNALSGLLAPMIGGVLYGFWGLTPIIIVAGVAFLISAIMEIFISIPFEAIITRESIFTIAKNDFAEGFGFMRKEKPILLRVILLVCCLNLFLSALLIVSMPVLITQFLNISDELYGISQGLLATGGLFGGIFVGLFGKKLNVNKVYILFLCSAIFLFPIGLALMLPITPIVAFWIITLCCFMIMAVATIGSILLLSFIQGVTPTNLVGKVISIAIALSMCSQPLGQALYGYLFEQFITAPHLIIFFCSIVIVIISILSKKVFIDPAIGELN